jgi:hypothetical protein
VQWRIVCVADSLASTEVTLASRADHIMATAATPQGNKRPHSTTSNNDNNDAVPSKRRTGEDKSGSDRYDTRHNSAEDIQRALNTTLCMYRRSSIFTNVMWYTYVNKQIVEGDVYHCIVIHAPMISMSHRHVHYRYILHAHKIYSINTRTYMYIVSSIRHTCARSLT